MPLAREDPPLSCSHVPGWDAFISILLVLIRSQLAPLCSRQGESRIDAKARIVSNKPASTCDKAQDLREIVSGVEIAAAWRRNSKDTRSCHSVKLDNPSSFTSPIYASLFEGDNATGEGNPGSQTSIDCWAKIPAIAPCDDAWVTEGKKGVARSPAA
ncbi:DUF736 family protein [Burkholderia sp. Bp9142]|uniref:DUF736 family protein n=1 Tax=Burkholderia sp. Bp9142 TaxID=2184573 RepID=UPI000F597743|nr:DUF736 family protein [Burkholderia sp. Bp9142]